MICPYCGHENFAGVDSCENCTQDLTVLDEPKGDSLVETSILESPLAEFRPRPPVVVSPQATVAEAVVQLCENRIGCVLVGSVDKVEGIFSERDVLLRIAHRYDEVASKPVAEFMTPDPEQLENGTPIAYALNRMSVGDFRHLPVTSEGRLTGVISLRDVVGFLGDCYPDLIPAANAE